MPTCCALRRQPRIPASEIWRGCKRARSLSCSARVNAFIKGRAAANEKWPGTQNHVGATSVLPTANVTTTCKLSLGRTAECGVLASPSPRWERRDGIGRCAVVLRSAPSAPPFHWSPGNAYFASITAPGRSNLEQTRFYATTQQINRW